LNLGFLNWAFEFGLFILYWLLVEFNLHFLSIWAFYYSLAFLIWAFYHIWAFSVFVLFIVVWRFAFGLLKMNFLPYVGFGWNSIWVISVFGFLL
jgi:hypothetical protein